MKTQVIEARKTGTGSTEGESPSGKAGAPKLDWTAPLMLDDGKGTGVEDVRGPDSEGFYRTRIDGSLRWYHPDGYAVYNLGLPRIINRPKPDAEPVEQLPADEGLAEQKRPFEETQSAFDVIADTVNSASFFPMEDTRWIDGQDVILFAHDMIVSARYCAGEWSEDTPVSPREYSGSVWSCFDDQFQFEIEETHPDPHFWHHGPVKGWRPALAEPDTVTVPRMTEAEAQVWIRDNISGTPRFAASMEILRALGLIRPDDPLHRFTASHPNWRDLDKEEAVRLALEQRGEG